MQVQTQPGESMEVETKEGMTGGNYKLDCKTRVEYASVPLSEVKDFHGLVSISAPEYEQENRSGIDCVCVLDVSGSMQGQKISLVRKAMRRLVRAMNSKDRVCFVTFDSNVNTLLDFTAMDVKGKETARKQIHALRPGSSTNLAGGLATGIEKMKELFLQGGANEVTSVLLFTDGEANVGERTVEGILRTAIEASEEKKVLNVDKWSPEEVGTWLDSVRLPYKEQFQNLQVDGQILLQDLNPKILKEEVGVSPIHLPKFLREIEKLKALQNTSTPGEASPQFSVTINTFGFGADHNNQLLNKIAESFDGMYYYMENEEAIVSGFANCLGGMLSTVAQEITLTVHPAVGVTGLKVHKTDHVTQNKDGSIQVVVGDIQAEENQDVVISGSLPAVDHPIDSCLFFTCEVLYRNLVADGQVCENLNAVVSRSASETKGELDVKVDIERNRVKATDAMEQAKKCGDAGKLAEGREIINAALKQLQSSPSAETKLIAALIKDLKTCLEGLQDRRQYRAVGKGYMMQNVRCHRKKRAANFRSSTYQSQAVYQTNSRSIKQQEFSIKDDSDSDDDDDLVLPNRSNARRPRPASRSSARGRRRMRAPPTQSAPPRNANSWQMPNLGLFSGPPNSVPQVQQMQLPVQQQQMQMPMQQQQMQVPMQQQQQMQAMQQRQMQMPQQQQMLVQQQQVQNAAMQFQLPIQGNIPMPGPNSNVSPSSAPAFDPNNELD